MTLLNMLAKIPLLLCLTFSCIEVRVVRVGGIVGRGCSCVRQVGKLRACVRRTEFGRDIVRVCDTGLPTLLRVSLSLYICACARMCVCVCVSASTGAYVPVSKLEICKMRIYAVIHGCSGVTRS